MALGAILGRFWAQVGGQVGAKLGRKSEKWRLQDDVRTCVVQNEHKCMQVYAGVCKPGGEDPLWSINQASQNNTMGIRTLPSGTRPGGGSLLSSLSLLSFCDYFGPTWRHLWRTFQTSLRYESFFCLFRPSGSHPSFIFSILKATNIDTAANLQKLPMGALDVIICWQASGKRINRTFGSRAQKSD